MPIVIIEGKESSKQVKEKIIREVSEVVSNAYELPIDAIDVVIHENKTDNVGVGGKQLTNINKA